MTNEKQAYEQKIEARIDELDAELQKLKARAEGAEADAKIAHQRRIEKLREKRDRARQHFEKLQHASGSAWEDIKHGLEKAADDLRDSIRAAGSRFD